MSETIGGLLSKRTLTMRTVAFFVSLTVFTLLLYMGKVTEKTFYDLFTSSLFIIGLDVAKSGVDAWKETKQREIVEVK